MASSGRDRIRPPGLTLGGLDPRASVDLHEPRVAFAAIRFGGLVGLLAAAIALSDICFSLYAGGSFVARVSTTTPSFAWP